EANLSLHEVVDGVDEVAQIAPQAIKLPDDQRVALAQRLEAGLQAGPVVLLARGAILVEVLGLDAGGCECVTVQVEHLRTVRLRHAHVADEHSGSCHLYGRLCDDRLGRMAAQQISHTRAQGAWGYKRGGMGWPVCPLVCVGADDPSSHPSVEQVAGAINAMI